MELNQMQMNTMLSAAAQETAAAQSQNETAENQQPSTELQLRAMELITQARTILAVAQVDVFAVYNTDAEIRTRVLNGEMDFIDVYKAIKPVSAPPAPVRGANGGVGTMNIGAMNEKQFDKLNQMLSRGMKVDMRY